MEKALRVLIDAYHRDLGGRSDSADPPEQQPMAAVRVFSRTCRATSTRLP